VITTVTTATITTVTTNTAAALAMIAIITLLVLLVNKELISNAASVRAQRLGKAFNIAIVPLLLVFVMTAVVQLIGALR
jgi:hypothetical protein